MSARLLVCGLCACLLVGCGTQSRRIVVTSDPSGARVHLNDIDVGVTPVEVDFTYFGVYEVRLAKSGYEPLVAAREAEAPIHEWPGFDLVAMALPGDEVTEIAWHFVLEESDDDPVALMERAREVRGMLGASGGVPE
ncbi:MAG: PEGA domain-containing protein [Planctomycetota bacterium]